MKSLMRFVPPITTPAIHIAGTNGKGSVSAMLDTCLLAAGLRTARYNSPHLVEPRDAIRIMGKPVTSDIYTNAIDRFTRIASQHVPNSTNFEIQTAAMYFIVHSIQPQMDIMTIECGMGGARDATNVIPPDRILASVVTSIGLDHSEYLGTTIGSIAEEKAKITPPGGLLIVAPNIDPQAMISARQVAADRNAKLYVAPRAKQGAAIHPVSLQNLTTPPRTVVEVPIGNSTLTTELSLGGPHQADNLSLALSVLSTLRCDPRALAKQPRLAHLTDDTLRRGIAAATWDGRCSWLRYKGRPLLVDGAHNSESAAALRQHIDTLEFIDQRTYILALSESKSKSPLSVLQSLLRKGDRVIATTFSPVAGQPWTRPVAPQSIEEAVRPWIGEGQFTVADDLASALESVGSGPGLPIVCGSLYLVADAYRLIGKGMERM